MFTLADRLQTALAEKNPPATQADLARACGIKPPSVNDWFKGKTRELRGTNLLKAADFLGVRQEWLADGRGPKNADAGVPQVYGINRALSDDVYVSITNVAASMGYGQVQPDFEYVVDYARMTRSWLRAVLPHFTSIENLGILPASGPSMEPTFKSGDMLIVDRGVKSVQSDAVYAFGFDGGVFVKRLIRNPITKTITAKSDNPLHGSFEIDQGHMESLHISGLVLYAWNGKHM